MREHTDRSGGWFGALAPWQRAHEDQGRVAGLLAELGPEGFRSLHRVDSGFGDIDHVVVGPTGVFSILTTHWTAPVHRKGDRLVCGTRDEDKTRRRAEWSATCVEQWLDDDDVGVPVAALLVPLDSRVEDDRLELPYLTVLPVASLTAFLRDGPVTLTPARVRRAAETIQARMEPAPEQAQARTAST
jgi:Nuclease-related domain